MVIESTYYRIFSLRHNLTSSSQLINKIHYLNYNTIIQSVYANLLNMQQSKIVLFSHLQFGV